MKIFLSIILLLNMILLTHAVGASPFIDGLNQKWSDGQKKDVLAAANQRLSANPNDITSLILKMDYQMEFVLLSDLADTMDRVVTVGQTIHTPKFSALFPDLKLDIENLKNNVIPLYTPDLIQQDKAKASIKGKTLPSLEILRACEADGLIR